MVQEGVPNGLRLLFVMAASTAWLGCLSGSAGGHAVGPAAGAAPVGLGRLSAGQHATCLVRDDGKVTCWGPLPHTLVDLSKQVDAVRPHELEGAPLAASVVLGDETCVVDRAGAAHCIDATTRAFGKMPLAMPLVTVSGDVARACALSREGALVCRDGPSWRTVAGFEHGVHALVTSVVHTCILRDDARVYCFGKGEAGLLGDPRLVDREAPTLVEGLEGVVQISTKRTHTCALRRDGKVSCWGLGDSGQLGDGVARPPNGFSAVPVEVRGLDGVSAISSGNAHTCALRRGKVLCWGSGLPTGAGRDRDRQTAPAEIAGLDGVVELAAGGGHQCALTADHAVWCWGVAWWVPSKGLRPTLAEPTKIELP